MGASLLFKGTSARYLGYLLGYKLVVEELDNVHIKKVRNEICKWSTKFLSLATRALIVNQIVLASIWYLTSCVVSSPTKLQNVTALV